MVNEAPNDASSRDSSTSDTDQQYATRDEAPRWRAMINIRTNKQYMSVLCDSGCTASCISQDYFDKNPGLKKNFKPMKSNGRAINGTEVPSDGEVSLRFSIKKEQMEWKFKVIKGLMDPIILGWDWMLKFQVKLDAGEGLLHFGNGRTAPLIENWLPPTACTYKVPEDLVLPPNSVVHTEVRLFQGAVPLEESKLTVITEPFSNNGSSFWAARTCSNTCDGMFRTEFTNTSPKSVKIEAGQAIGFAKIVDSEKLEDTVLETEMFCAFQGSEAKEEKPNSEPEERPKSKPKEKREPSRQENAGSDIPPGAKPLKLDLSGVADDAKPYLPQLEHLLKVKHGKAFSKHDRDYGRTHLIQYRAHMKDPDENPIASSPYRTRPEMREVIDEQAHQMIADGLVGHSQSPFAAPILLNKKKCGGWRFLTDFRKINERCNKVVYPLPRIEDSIQRLENPRYFTSLDLTKGFWQIPVHPEDRKFFAFSTESMHLEYLVAPMGAKNSPSYLSALMQLVLRGLPIQNVVSYLDDILIADVDMETHLKHLDQVLSAIEKAGLKLNPAKSLVARESVVCLGHKLSRDGVSPDPANIEKVKTWKAPNNPKKLRAFLGLTGYYRQFIKGYSKIAGCLTDLTRDNVKWHWNSEHQRAFETLRDTLMSDLVMCYPNFKEPFIVKTDASKTAIGYVLTQKIDNKERVISYGSKKLSQTQQRWSTYDREYFALIAGIRANAHYLRHAKFFVITDHRPLLAWRKTNTLKDPTGRRTRWACELDNYEFTLIYKKGATHLDADAMSRRGDEDDEVAEDDDNFFLANSFFAKEVSLEDLWEQQQEERYFMGMDCDCGALLASMNADEDDIERLQSEQQADSIIPEVMEFVRKRKRPPKGFPANWYRKNFKALAIRDGILYRKSFAKAAHRHTLQAVIPDAMVSEVMEDLHGSQWAGHPSLEKMLQIVKRYAIWPTLRQDLMDKATNCQTCDRLREQVPKPVTPLQPIVARSVFDHVMCDLVSFGVPSYGFNYVLVFKDVFSGFIKCYKLRDKTSNGVVKAFEDLVCSLGPPKMLTSDNGGEFISKSLKQACKMIGVQKRTSVPYRPQSQGNVERQNRILIDGLQKRLLDYGKSWSEHLPYVEYVHNTTPFSKTGMSPYLVFFGREPYLPPYAPKENAVKDVKSSQFLQELRDRAKELLAETNRKADEQRKKETERYNRKVKHEPFEVGDRVYEKVEVRSNKLDPKWSQPHRIKSRSRSPTGEPGTTYVCERPDGTTSRRNYEQLKKVNARFEENMRKPLEDKVVQAKMVKALLMAAAGGTEPPPFLPPPPPPQLPAQPQASVDNVAVDDIQLAADSIREAQSVEDIRIERVAADVVNVLAEMVAEEASSHLPERLLLGQQIELPEAEDNARYVANVDDIEDFPESDYDEEFDSEDEETGEVESDEETTPTNTGESTRTVKRANLNVSMCPSTDESSTASAYQSATELEPDTPYVDARETQAPPPRHPIFDLLNSPAEAQSPPSNTPRGATMDASPVLSKGPSDLITVNPQGTVNRPEAGEVGASNTRPPVRTLPVESADIRAYYAKSAVGRIPITRLTERSASADATRNRGDAPEDPAESHTITIARSTNSIPTGLDQLPTAESEQREYRPKIRQRDEVIRPSGRVRLDNTGAIDYRRANEPTSQDNQEDTRLRQPRHNLRDATGRFKKKQ